MARWRVVGVTNRPRHLGWVEQSQQAARSLREAEVRAVEHRRAPSPVAQRVQLPVGHRARVVDLQVPAEALLRAVPVPLAGSLQRRAEMRAVEPHRLAGRLQLAEPQPGASPQREEAARRRAEPQPGASPQREEAARRQVVRAAFLARHRPWDGIRGTPSIVVQATR